MSHLNEPTAANEKKKSHVEVAVITTSGTWPHDGYEDVPIGQPIKDELHRAVHELKIKDTTNWIARYGTRELDPSKSYKEEGLEGRVDIDYGPREGGGGHA